MQARKINDVIEMTETKINSPLYDLFEIVEELSLQCAPAEESDRRSRH
ncbi:hypothetical protein V3C99_005324 [Haemonchus contortus]